MQGLGGESHLKGGFGTKEGLGAYLKGSLVSRHVNKSFWKGRTTRCVGTRRFTCKRLGFSRSALGGKGSYTCVGGYDPFCFLHGGLWEGIEFSLAAKGGSSKGRREVSEMMAAGERGDGWSLRELLTWRVPPDSQKNCINH